MGAIAGSREFLRVVSLDGALALARSVEPLPKETVDLSLALGRVLGEAVTASSDVPGFARSTVDGYAVRASSTFGASEGLPALLSVVGEVRMGRPAEGTVGPAEAVRIPTGGMLPLGADAVVMVEHVEVLDEGAVETARSVAPGEGVIAADEDVACGSVALTAGTLLRPQEIGLLAALGVLAVPVHRRPRVAILSTGDEVVPVSASPGPGQVRDVNSHALAAQVLACGGIPVPLGTVGDEAGPFRDRVVEGLAQAELLLVSGGSSVGARDLTLDVLERLEGCEILVHGVAIRPGKPTILARVGRKMAWGLPGHVASSMVVFDALVRPMIERLAGQLEPRPRPRVPARLSRNVASVHGRTDFLRVRLARDEAGEIAVPLLGRSGLLRPMAQADGMVEIPRDCEGLDAGAEVYVTLL